MSKHGARTAARLTLVFLPFIAVSGGATGGAGLVPLLPESSNAPFRDGGRDIYGEFPPVSCPSLMRSYLDFAKALEACPDEDAAFAHLERSVGEFGYHTVDYATGILPRWPVERASEWRIDGYRTTFGWESEYTGTEFQKFDRTVPFASSRTTPWLYWDLWSRPAEHETARRMEATVQSRIVSGIGIPLHGPGMRFTGAHLGSLLRPDELERLDRETRPVVSMICALFSEQYLRRRPQPAEHKLGRRSQPAAPPAITGRERECLLWAACGKTAWETAKILGLSESAVKKHLAAAAFRLGAQTRTQAVAVALTRGLISV